MLWSLLIIFITNFIIGNMFEVYIDIKNAEIDINLKAKTFFIWRYIKHIVIYFNLQTNPKYARSFETMPQIWYSSVALWPMATSSVTAVQIKIALFQPILTNKMSYQHSSRKSRIDRIPIRLSGNVISAFKPARPGRPDAVPACPAEFLSRFGQ